METKDIIMKYKQFENGTKRMLISKAEKGVMKLQSMIDGYGVSFSDYLIAQVSDFIDNSMRIINEFDQSGDEAVLKRMISVYEMNMKWILDEERSIKFNANADSKISSYISEANMAFETIRIKYDELDGEVIERVRAEANKLLDACKLGDVNAMIDANDDLLYAKALISDAFAEEIYGEILAR